MLAKHLNLSFKENSRLNRHHSASSLKMSDRFSLASYQVSPLLIDIKTFLGAEVLVHASKDGGTKKKMITSIERNPAPE